MAYECDQTYIDRALQEQIWQIKRSADAGGQCIRDFSTMSGVIVVAGMGQGNLQT